MSPAAPDALDPAVAVIEGVMDGVVVDPIGLFVAGVAPAAPEAGVIALGWPALPLTAAPAPPLVALAPVPAAPEVGVAEAPAASGVVPVGAVFIIAFESPPQPLHRASDARHSAMGCGAMKRSLPT
jgi:hypothetical protein